jgi:PAS domain S-box-containing protein
MGTNSHSFDEPNLSQARLDNSQRIAGLGDWEHDYVNHHLFWSEEVYRILGLSRNDYPPDSATFYLRVHPDDLAYVHQKKKTASHGLCRVDFEHRIIRPNGEVRHIHQIAETAFDAHGQPLRESGTIQDISERKLAEENLRQSETRFRTLSESVPLGVFECDAAGRVIYYNPAMAGL